MENNSFRNPVTARAVTLDTMVYRRQALSTPPFSGVFSAYNAYYMFANVRACQISLISVITIF